MSRERGAPRAGHRRNHHAANGLRLMSLLIVARGARVSRAARRGKPLNGERPAPTSAVFAVPIEWRGR